jgi:hypothetical protein
VVQVQTCSKCAPSKPSVSVTPAGPPAAPTNVVATINGCTTATVSFTAPVSTNGNGAITYSVFASPSVDANPSQSGSGTSIQFTKLNPGQAYTFSVVATQGQYTSALSAASNSVTVPSNLPSAPILNSVTGSTGTAKAVFQAGTTSQCQSSVSSYTVSAVLAGSLTATNSDTSSPISITGLIGTTTYSVSVVANSAAGASASSQSISVTIPSSSAAACLPPAPVSFGTFGSACSGSTVQSGVTCPSSCSYGSPSGISALCSNGAWSCAVPAACPTALCSATQSITQKFNGQALAAGTSLWANGKTKTINSIT